MTTDDLDLARHRRQIEALEDQAEYRLELAPMREVRDYQQAKGGWLEALDSGAGSTR